MLVLARTKFLICVTLILIGFVVLGGGCTNQTPNTPSDVTVAANSLTPKPQVTTTYSPTTVLPSVIRQNHTSTFTDPALGIALDVPSDWSIHPRTEPITGPWVTYSGFSSPCPISAPITMPPCTGIDIVPGPSPIHSLDEIKGNLVPDGSKIFEKKQVDLNGLPALWIRTELGESDTAPKHPIIRVWILAGIQIIRLTAYGDLTSVPEIINTIRPASRIQ